MKIKFHKDGNITWFSVLFRQWRTSRVVSSQELATMPNSERIKIIAYMIKHQ
jgi:hypothetical protein